jgi:mannose-6-phosphate isomerase-like protein (cupin superfamily)
MSQLHEAARVAPIALGPGEGERIWFTDSTFTFKATAASTGGELFLMEATLPSGSGPPLHVHHNEHEAFYVLDGRLEIVCGQDRFEAGAGAFAFLPSGIAHTFRAIGDGPSRVLTIAVPGAFGEFFREFGRPAEGAGLPPPAPVDIPALRQMAARYGTEFVGPPLGQG